MENNILNVSDELLDNLSLEQLAELKVEVEDLLEKLKNIENDNEVNIN